MPSGRWDVVSVPCGVNKDAVRLRASAVGFYLQMTFPLLDELKSGKQQIADDFAPTELKLGHPPIGEAAAMCFYFDEKLAQFHPPLKEASMPRKPRCEITDPNSVQVFHWFSDACVEAWLCGGNPHSGSLMSIRRG